MHDRWSFILQRSEMKLNFRFSTKWIINQFLSMQCDISFYVNSMQKSSYLHLKFISFVCSNFRIYLSVPNSGSIYVVALSMYWSLRFVGVSSTTTHSFESPTWNVNIQDWVLLFQLLIYETCLSIVMWNIWHNLQFFEGG